MENTSGKHQLQLPLCLSAQCQGTDDVNDACLNSIVIHFRHTAMIALVRAFICAGPDTSLSSLFPLFNLATVLVTSLFAVQLPKKGINGLLSLEKPSMNHKGHNEEMEGRDTEMKKTHRACGEVDVFEMQKAWP